MQSNSSNKVQESGDSLGFVAFSTGVQLVLFVLFYFLLYDDGISEAGESIFYFAFFSTAPLISVVGFYLLSSLLTRSRPRIRLRLMRHVMTALPISVVLFGMLHMHRLVYFTYEVPPPSIPLSGMRFAIGVLCFGLVAAALAYYLFGTKREGLTPSQRGKSVPVPLRVVGIALVISLLDVYMMIDSASFAPYVAPAFLVANGQRPMIDAFSQYGPNFLIFAAAFKVLPESFFTVAAVVAVMNVLMYLTFLGIAVNISRNKTAAFIIAVCTILFVHSAHLYNINYTPSVFAMRFFPPLLLIYALSLLRTQRLFSPLTLVALGICSLWALESLVFGVLTYSVFVLIQCIENRRTFTQYVGALTGVFALVVLVHISVCGGYILFFGRLPDYLTYLQLVLFHLDGGAYWNLPIEPGIRVWSMFGFAYTTMLALAFYRSLCGANRADDGHIKTNAIMGAVSVLGLLMFYYYIGRSATPILMFISLPMFLIFIRSTDWALSNLLYNGTLNILGDAPARATAVFIVVAFTLMGGVFVDKFFRPYSQHLSNSTELRSLLSSKERRVSLRERLTTWRSAVPSETYPINEAGGSLTYTHTENYAAFDLIRKFGEADARVLLFIADPVPVIFYTPPVRRHAIVYPAYASGLAYPAVDGLSSNLTARTFTMLEDVKLDDVVVIGTLKRATLDEKVIDHLTSKWLLCKVDLREKVTAYKLRPKSDVDCSP